MTYNDYEKIFTLLLDKWIKEYRNPQDFIDYHYVGLNDKERLECIKVNLITTLRK